MRLRYPVRTLLAIGIFIAVSAAHAEEEHRQLGPHVHGSGTLAIVVEENNVQMEFSAPGMDIVGFEYEPETAREKKAVETALADLKEPLKLFALPQSTECSVASADVEIVAEDHDDHDDGAKSNEDSETEDHGPHTEFRASYALACADAAAIKSIYFPFFARFPGTEKLDVTVINANGETSYEVSRELSRLDEM